MRRYSLHLKGHMYTYWNNCRLERASFTSISNYYVSDMAKLDVSCMHLHTSPKSVKPHLEKVGLGSKWAGLVTSTCAGRCSSQGGASCAPPPHTSTERICRCIPIIIHAVLLTWASTHHHMYTDESWTYTIPLIFRTKSRPGYNGSSPGRQRQEQVSNKSWDVHIM